ncbi:MAG: hypothetical protein J3K34DRAFT_525541 [Monoraphidium minutum]|nr:MAG: hypothetical protein J3K34DRAFT_525541 [Monoraphidium minutum]
MEASNKDRARSRFRQQRHNDRSHRRRGAGAQAGGAARGAARRAPELESNADRYLSEDELEGGGEEGAAAAPRPLSRGADLARLLADTEPLYAQAHYRHRALLEPGGGGGAEGGPPGAELDAAAAEGLLEIDLAALGASLAALPLGELLGVREEYLAAETCGLEAQGAWPAPPGGGAKPPAAPPAPAPAVAAAEQPRPPPPRAALPPMLAAAAAAGAARPAAAGPAPLVAPAGAALAAAAAAPAPVLPVAVLGLPASATPAEIRARYRELAKETHPDVSGAPDAEARFLEVRRAYDVLSQELLRAEHDAQLGFAGSSANDPRFARFNRWRAEVVPELRAQLRIWSDEVYQIIRSEAARWRHQIDRARRRAAAAAAAADALAARRGAAGAGAAVVGAAGAGRFDAAPPGARGEAQAAHAAAAAASNWEPYGSGDGGGEEPPYGGGGGGGAHFGCSSEEVRLSEALRDNLGDLWESVRELQGAVAEGQACVQRQYDKRIEQVAARYRVYGEVVWYDIWEEFTGPWLGDAAAQDASQRAALAEIEAAAHDLARKAEAVLTPR